MEKTEFYQLIFGVICILLIFTLVITVHLQTSQLLETDYGKCTHTCGALYSERSLISNCLEGCRETEFC